MVDVIRSCHVRLSVHVRTVLYLTSRFTFLALLYLLPRPILT